MDGKLRKQEFALYKGDKLLCIGTPAEIAQERNVRIETILHYGFPSYKKRLAKRKVVKNALELVPLDDEL